jgi:hypothetical protein
METIVLKPFYHDSQDCIGIYFPDGKLLNQCIKKIGGARWNPNGKC